MRSSTPSQYHQMKQWLTMLYVENSSEASSIGNQCSKIHHRVHDRSDVGPPLATARLGWRNQWCNTRSSFVRSLGTRWSRVYFGRFSSVHIGDPSANQVTPLESNRFTRFKKFQNGH